MNKVTLVPRNKNKWKQKRWKIRHQAKQIINLVERLNHFNANARKIIIDYQLECEQTAAQYCESPTETGQRLYWRADGAIDALEFLLTKFPDRPIRRDVNKISLATIKARIEKFLTARDWIEYILLVILAASAINVIARLIMMLIR